MTESEFAGTLYLTDSPDAMRVQVRVDAAGIVARGADDREHRIAIAGCKLERGGLNGRVWTCFTPDRRTTLLIDHPGFPVALREHAPADVVAALDRMLVSGAREQRRSGRNWVVVLAVVCVFLAGTYYSIRTASAAAVDALPTSVDTRLGDQAFAGIKAQNTVVEDPVLAAALDQTLARLSTSRSGERTGAFSYRVHVFDEPSANAFALPGGNLVVHTGLIRAARSAEQVAGVLAHEIAHVERRHGMRRIARSLGVVAAFELFIGDVSGFAGVAVDLLREGAINSYSREQEQQADFDAVKTLKRARINPGALAEFLDLLRRQEPGLPSALEWLGTHPDLGQRVADIRTAAGDTQRRDWEPLGIDWAQLQRRLPSGSKAAPKGSATEAPAKPLQLVAAD